MDLKGTQLKQTFGNLATIGTSAGTPTTGILQNGDGSNITALGIGTDSPSHALHTLSTNSTIAKFEHSDGTNGFIQIKDTGNSVFLGMVSNDFVVQTSPDGSTFGTKFTVADDGKVGIGTTDPDEILHIAKSSGDTIMAVEANDGNAALYLTSAGTNKDNRIVSGNAKALKFEAQASGSGQGQGQDPTATATTVMTLTNDGCLLVNTTDSTPNGVSNKSHIIGVNDGSGLFAGHFATNTNSGATAVVFSNTNGLVGFISTSGSGTTYSTSSDYRLKENVVPMEGALDRISQLKPSRFNFIADADTTVDGFLAHEVSNIVPEAITGEKDEVEDDGTPVYQGIDQSKLVPLLVGAIQELKAEIEQLKNK